MVKPEAEGTAGSLSIDNPQRLYGCPSNVVYGQSQLGGMHFTLHVVHVLHVYFSIDIMILQVFHPWFCVVFLRF